MWAEQIMMALQVFCCGEALCRGLYWKALYWFGAFLLTIAIVKGLKSCTWVIEQRCELSGGAR